MLEIRRFSPKYKSKFNGLMKRIKGKDMAKAKAKSEKLEFRAEVKQLLHLMIHSLYSNKDIVLRELISNASDAADKLRFEALADSSLYEKDSDLNIRIAFDAKIGRASCRERV